MPRFKSNNFYQNRSKVTLFLLENTNFRSLCLRALLVSLLQTSSLRQMGVLPPTPQKIPLLQISSRTPESNHVFAPQISMPSFKRINSNQNKLKLRGFCKKYKSFEIRVSAPKPPIASGGAPRPPKRPLPLLQIFDYTPDARCVLLILLSFRILQ